MYLIAPHLEGIRTKQLSGELPTTFHRYFDFILMLFIQSTETCTLQYNAAQRRVASSTR